MNGWPATVEALVAEQERLGRERRPSCDPRGVRRVGGCAVCFRRGGPGPGAAGDPGFAGAALFDQGRLVGRATVGGPAGADFEPGLLALREGPLLEAATRALPRAPEVLL